MAILTKEKAIEFSSIEEFLEHYESHISKGGFYLDSQEEWELRKEYRFSIVIINEPRRVHVRAQVVFCGGGKVGLEMAKEHADHDVVRTFAKNLGKALSSNGAAKGPVTSPKLKDDGTILYDTLQDFIQDYDANLAEGTLYAESVRAWPKGRQMVFLVRVRGNDDVDMPLSATVISVDRGLVGLRLELDESLRNGLASLVEVLRDVQDEELDEKDVAVDNSPKNDLISRGLVYSTRDAAEFVPLEIFPIRPDVKPQTTLFGLIASIVEAKRPVRLELVSNQIAMSFRFKSDGTLVDFTGPNSELDLLRRLVKASFLDKAQSDEIANILNPGKTVVEHLTEKKVVSRKQLMLVLGAQAVDALESIRAAGQVPFRIFTQDDIWEEGLEFGAFVVNWLDRALRTLEVDTIKEMLADFKGRSMKLRTDSRDFIDSLSMDSQSLKFLTTLDGTKSIPAIVASFPKNQRNKLFRVALILRTLRLVDLLKPAVDSNKVRNEIEQLRQEVEKIQKADKFVQAGVHWSAHRNMYAKAMMDLQRKYGRASPLSQKGQEAAALCRKRIEIARIANEYLADANQRQAYRQDVVSDGLREDAALMLFRKGQAQISDDNARGALEFLEMAVELAPDNTEYREKLLKVKTHLKLGKK